MTNGDVANEPSPTLFGHPVGLFTLFFAEMWERFSYYGMRALLVLYMVKGFLRFDDNRAYAVAASYAALVYATPFFGGLIADRLLGARHCVVIGGLLMAAGHLTMTIEHTTAFYLALSLLICGNGFFKPNISTMVGSLYPSGDSRRDSGFTIFYIGINLGAAIAPLLCGYVGEVYGWHRGFGLATIGMLIGVAVFVAPTRLTQSLILVGAVATAAGMVTLPSNAYLLAVNGVVAAALIVSAIIAVIALQRGGVPGEIGRPQIPLAQRRFGPLRVDWIVYLGIVPAIPLFALLLQRNQLVLAILVGLGPLALGYLLFYAIKSDRIVRERLFVVLILTFFSMLFWAFFEQAGSSINNFTDRNVDRVFEQETVSETQLGSVRELVLTQEQVGFPDGLANRQKPAERAIFTLSDLATARRQAGQQASAARARWHLDHAHLGMGIADTGDEIPASTFQSVNPIFILTFGLLFSWLWTYLGRRRLEPSTPTKFALGLAQLGLGFAALWYGTQTADARGMVAMRWLLLGYLLHTTGELCISPVGLSMVTKLSPASIVSTVMGSWFLAASFANFLAGLVAKLTSVTEVDASGTTTIPPPIESVHVYGHVYGTVALISLGSALFCLLLAPLLKRWMHSDLP